jgi:DNA-binding NarL/FixJ family response regulator
VTIRIVIVDDQAVVRAGFRMILGEEADLEVVGEADDGRAAIDLVRGVHPDVVVMDVRMPRLDGLAATEAILSLPLSPPPRVLVVTTFDLDDYVFGALSAGASGFLLKDVTPPELISAVRVVASGESVVSPRATRELINRYVSSARPGQRDPRTDRLTSRELDVLRALARGWSNAEIGAALHLTEATVKTHVSRVLTKLELRSRVQAVVLAYRTGLDRPADDHG